LRNHNIENSSGDAAELCFHLPSGTGEAI